MLWNFYLMFDLYETNLDGKKVTGKNKNIISQKYSQSLLKDGLLIY